MAVQVETKSGIRRITKTGQKWDVSDGILHVLDDHNALVASYSEWNWVRLMGDEEPKPEEVK